MFRRKGKRNLPHSSGVNSEVTYNDEVRYDNAILPVQPALSAELVNCHAHFYLHHWYSISFVLRVFPPLWGCFWIGTPL